MEFRQVVSVCRSAAAATRPSLASTRPSPSSILLQQRHFTNNPKQQSEAAAVAEQQLQDPRYERTARLQHSLSLSQNRGAPMPPRPPFRESNMLDSQKRSSPVWAIPQNTKNNTGPQPLIRSTMLTGRAPTGTSNSNSSSSNSNLYNLPSQITNDMEQALGTGPSTGAGTGMMSTWNEDAFLAKNYDVSEPELRLRPSTGRTVDIKGSVDLARGFRLLQRSVAQNRVKTDVRLSKFYERPALKRKRQKRERWQVRFKDGFKACIARAMELKGQGW